MHHAHPPYALDLTSRQIFNGVALYQLRALRDFGIRRDFRPTGPHRLWITKGTRGGWVPSLDVLSSNQFGTPWLNEHSWIVQKDTHIQGPVLLQRSQWIGTGRLEVLWDKHADMDLCTFEGHNTISIQPLSKLSVQEQQEIDQSQSTALGGLSVTTDVCVWLSAQCQDVHSKGLVQVQNSKLSTTYLSTRGKGYISDTQVEASHLSNETHGGLVIQQSTLRNVQLHKAGATNPLVLRHAKWEDVLFKPVGSPSSPSPISEFSDLIEHSTLTRVSSRHPYLGYSWCVNPVPHHVLSLPPPPPPPVVSTKEAPLHFVPIQSVYPESRAHKPPHEQFTHFVWYMGPTPVAFYDIHHQQFIDTKDLSAYIDTFALDTASTHSKKVLQWWQWQHALGMALPKDQAWICPDLTDPPAVESLDLSMEGAVLQ